MSEETIFAAALELPPADRDAYLASACGNDAALRKRLAGLLAASDRAGRFMERPVVAPADPNTEFAEEKSTPNDVTVSRAGSYPAADIDDSLAFLDPARRPDSLGRIGHYEVLQVLGKGGFGIVFRAFDETLQRVVAVKVMAPQIAATSPARKRFLREARSSAQVRHENVVQVHEVVEHPLPYLVMEFIPGETLQQRLDRTGPVDPAEVVRIGRQIAEGLAAAHANDLIHRDVKPGNILLESGPQGRVKLTDFGLARAADDASISQSGLIAGTPMYMAPEQALGHKLDQRADLFSLGSVLYQMTCGRPPFRANSTVAVLKRVAEDRPRDIREIIPETPPWLCNIIARLHEKNPDDRYQTAREIADVLADCEQQLKAHGAIKDFSRIPGGQPAPPARRRGIGRKWKWVAAVLLAVVLGSAASAWFIPPVSRFVDNRAELAFELTDPDFERAIVYAGEDVVADVDPKSSPTIQLAPGQYTLEIRTRGGRALKWWYYTRHGLKHGRSAEPPSPGDRIAFRLDVVRGERVVLTATLKPPGTPGPQPDPGWVQLFNGKDLTGWETPRPGTWKVEHGVLIGTGGVEPQGAPLATKRRYYDFAVRVEAKINVGGRAGLMTRWVEAPRGYKALISSGDSRGTGTLEAMDADKTRTLHRVDQSLVPADTWFTMEVIGRGRTLTLLIDGRQVTQLEDDAFSEGAVGLVLSKGTLLSVRKFEIKELPASPPSPADGWVSLLNGKDLAGWKTHPEQPGTWEVKDGILTGSTRQSHLFTERADYANFHLRAEIRLNLGGDTGIRFRAPFTLQRGPKAWQVLPDGGYEAELTRLPVASARTGSVWRVNTQAPPTLLLKADTDVLGDSDEWLTYEVIADGNQVITKVNGREVANCVDPQRAYVSGHIALQCFSAQTIVKVRRIEIRELPPAVAPFTDADANRIAALPAADQVEEVRKELMRRNPGFDGRVDHKIEGDAVTEFAFNTDQVLDVSPVRALLRLDHLDLRGTYPNKGQLADLSPLRGMKRLSRLDCSSTQISDLTPLSGVPLTTLHVSHNPVSDLTPLKGMPLEHLGIAETKVSDLTPLKGLKLKTLGAQLLPATDLSPLEGMPLTGLDLYHTVGVTKLDALRGLPLVDLNLQDLPVSDLSPLKGMTTLRTLNLAGNRVTDLSPLAGLKLTDLLLHDEQITDLAPLQGMPLARLHLDGTGVRDLRPLQGMPLQEIRLNPANITQGLDVLRAMKGLKTIGIDGTRAWPAAEFWERYDRGEFK